MTKCFGSGTPNNLTLIWTDNWFKYILTPLNSGLSLTPTQTANQPNVSWYAQTNKYYHFLMVDPDAPTPDRSTADYLHCLIINIHSINNNINNGDIKEVYRSPAPPRSASYG